MPTYQYKCSACGHEFEEFQKMTDDPIQGCPKCLDSSSVQRVISGGAGFLLKGSGFYATDYRSESYKKAAQLDSDKAKNEKLDKKNKKSSSDSKSS